MHLIGTIGAYQGQSRPDRVEVPMPAKKWTKAQRAKFSATMRRRNNPPARVEHEPIGSFFTIRSGKPYPVNVKRITLLVIS
jgi:hypothetical protein